MPVVELKVFEQYEYHDYLITIQDHYGGPSLRGVCSAYKICTFI
jgi:hypothetical protein